MILKRLNLVETATIFTLLLAAIVINLRMIRHGFSGYGDMMWHITWIQHFSKHISEGIWYPRWLAGTNFGYGSPTFVFYPPLVYYLASIIKLLGLNIEQTITSLFTLTVFLSGLNFYLYARNKWEKIPSLLGAFSYMTCPGIIILIHGGGLAFVFALSLIPLGLYLTDRTLNNPRWGIGLALFWASMTLTHVPSLLLSAIAWFFYTIFFLFKRSWKTVFFTLTTAPLGFGLAAFYLFPAILEQPFVNIENMKTSRGGFQANMLKISTQIQGGLTEIFNQQLLAIILLLIIGCFCYRTQQENLKEMWRWCAYLLILLFMISELSWPIWQASYTLQMVQSPWRLGGLFYLGEAGLFAFIVRGIIRLNLAAKIISFVLVALVLTNNFYYGYKLTRTLPTLHNPGRGVVENVSTLKIAIEEPYTDKLIDVAEYRPLLKNNFPSPPKPILGEPKYSLLEGKADIKIETWETYRRTLHIKVEEFAAIRIRLYYYPAWHLYINDKSQTLDIYRDGTIVLKLPRGTYKIELRHQLTFAFMLGIAMSIFFFIVLIILIMNYL